MPLISGFSRRWHQQDEGPNPISEALALRKQSGQPVLDLTVSNPTGCRLQTPENWTRSLNSSELLKYDPQPQGSLKARLSIAKYYAERGESIDASDLFLTSGTSEGYLHLFKLLCDPGDAVLIPRPSYPLLETLANLEGVKLTTYPLNPQVQASDGNIPWYLDRQALEASLTSRTRALFVIQPGNPTGSILTRGDQDYLLALAEAHQLALVVDEVFADSLQDSLPLLRSDKILVFTLNGLSKILGLPQLKLAWIHVRGTPSLLAKAKAHLEWMCDAYLSVSTAAQVACSELLPRRLEFQRPLRERLQTNLSALRALAAAHPALQPWWPQGGWCVPLFCDSRNPDDILDDETLALELLRTQGVLTHPGYFFDFKQESILVVSLLVEPEIFREGIQKLAQTLEGLHQPHIIS